MSEEGKVASAGGPLVSKEGKVASAGGPVVSEGGTNLLLSLAEREQLLGGLGGLLKEVGLLKQELRTREGEALARLEALFLELLGVVDSIESLIAVVKERQAGGDELLKRLPRSLELQRKMLLDTLERRGVTRIELDGSAVDYEVCRVLDREPHPELAAGAIARVIRPGYRHGPRILRPAEVILSSGPP